MKKWLPMILGFLLLLTGISYSHAASVADQIISTGTSYMGTPYQYGAPAGQTKSFDCSSFTQYIFGQNGVYLPRTSKEQYSTGSWVTRSNLQKGDLVFFDTDGTGSVSHIGVYVGNGEMLHASTSVGVTISKFEGNPYWEPRYMGAKRVLQSQVVTTPATSGVSYKTHTVASGDTLWIIANKYGTSISTIKALNNLSSDMIYVGQVLKVSKLHTVASGDTLWIIANKYGTSIATIKYNNGLSSDMIYVGQTLKIV